MKKLSSQGFGFIGFLLLILVAGLISGAGLYVARHNSSAPGTGDKAADQKSLTVLDRKIPLINCVDAKKLINQELDGDMCYAAQFKVDGESIHYIVVKQSSAYQQKQASECTLDCGGNIPLTREDYIVRAGGAVELAGTDWAPPAEPYIDELTGCGQDKFFSLNSSQGVSKFALNQGRVVVDVSLRDVSLPDDYGNGCTVSAKLMYGSSSTGPLIQIQQLSVRYALQDVSHCQQLAQRKVYGCFSAQAAMRDDLSLCDKSIDPSDLGDGAKICIQGIAERRKDPAICNMIQNTWRQTCIKDTTEIKTVFSGKLVIN